LKHIFIRREGMLLSVFVEQREERPILPNYWEWPLLWSFWIVDCLSQPVRSNLVDSVFDSTNPIQRRGTVKVKKKETFILETEV